MGSNAGTIDTPSNNYNKGVDDAIYEAFSAYYPLLCLEKFDTITASRVKIKLTEMEVFRTG